MGKLTWQLSDGLAGGRNGRKYMELSGLVTLSRRTYVDWIIKSISSMAVQTWLHATVAHPQRRKLRRKGRGRTAPVPPCSEVLSHLRRRPLWMEFGIELEADWIFENAT